LWSRKRFGGRPNRGDALQRIEHTTDEAERLIQEPLRQMRALNAGLRAVLAGAMIRTGIYDQNSGKSGTMGIWLASATSN
jgi:hypothetical protein